MMKILPIISMSQLQRSAKDALADIKEYAVIQRHGKDIAFVLPPEMGHFLLRTGLLEELQKKCAEFRSELAAGTPVTLPKKLEELDHLIGQVLRELSKK